MARPAWRLLIVAATTAGVIEPVAFQWRNHPNQTAYIQPLAGGPKHAFARYDLDYWGNCLLQGLSYVNVHEPGEQVYVSGSPMLVLQADLSRFPRLVLAEPTDPARHQLRDAGARHTGGTAGPGRAPNLEARISTRTARCSARYRLPTPDGQHRLPDREAQQGIDKARQRNYEAIPDWI